MTDVEQLAEWFPGVDVDGLEATVDRLDDPTPERVAGVLDELAARGIIPTADYTALLRQQRDEGLVAAACERCGKPFLGDDREAAQRAVNGHKSSHGVDGSAPAADAADAAPASIEDVEERLEEQTDREAGEYPNAFRAVPDLEEAGEAEREAETDGGG